MNILAMSDLHGYLPEVPEFDLLLIAGDICPVWNHSVKYQEEWLRTEFLGWLQNLPYKDEFSNVFFIAGNHDFRLSHKGYHEDLMYDWFTKPTQGRAIYLQDNYYDWQYLNSLGELVELSIYGSPWSHRFGDWAFMKDEEDLVEIYKNIPKKLDILISHDAPFGFADYVQNRVTYNHENQGGRALREAIIEKEPKVVICGHLHEPYNNSILPKIGNSKIYNVASIDEEYQLKEKYYTKIEL